MEGMISLPEQVNAAKVVAVKEQSRLASLAE